VYKEREIQWGMGDTLNSLGWLESGQATYQEAINLHREALAHHQAISHEEGVIESLFGLALAYYKLGENEKAATLAGKAETLRQNLNLEDVAFLHLHHKALPELPLELLKTETGWQKGANMSLEEITEKVLGVRHQV
jgi:tetratricopeptide (TPR) repeat protein